MRHLTLLLVLLALLGVPAHTAAPWRPAAMPTGYSQPRARVKQPKDRSAQLHAAAAARRARRKRGGHK